MSFIPRLFLPDIPSALQEITLDESIAHYLTKVLRLKEGDRFQGFDPKGFEYDLILRGSGSKPSAEIVKKRETLKKGTGVFIALGQSLPKAAKMDLILRQGTEVGVHRFIPLITQRSVSRPDVSRFDHKNDRWKKILVEACRQCGRSDIPQLDTVTDWEKCLDLFGEFDRVLMPYEKEAPTLKTVLESNSAAQKILVLIGPEGGWSVEEIREAEAKGASPVHLPTPILRTETAGVAVSAMIQFFLSHPAADKE
jgi:16S rRNA (uracil1498-N3)-methyltransferase